MIHGYLGTGKTTFARKLERELPAIRFSHDEWITRIFGHQQLEPETMLVPVSDLIERCWTRCVELGLDVVLDGGFWDRKSRDNIRAKAAALGAGCRLYRLSVPDEVAWARVEQRNKNLQDNWFIDRNAFEVLKSLRGFDPLGRMNRMLSSSPEDLKPATAPAACAIGRSRVEKQALVSRG